MNWSTQTATREEVGPPLGRSHVHSRPAMVWACLLLGWQFAPGAQAFTGLAETYGGCAQTAITQTIAVGPLDDYQGTVDGALAGQRIQFAAGTYANGLRVYDLNGTTGNCIVLEGPVDQSAVFAGQPLDGDRNVVQIRNSSYLMIRNLVLDGAGTTDLDAIKSDANTAGAHPNPWSHHLVLENLWIHDFDFDQQQVGISTKGPAWNWVVRNNVIERVGTGIYFGNSNGAEHFVNGLIEFNLIRDTIGYNMQVKHKFAASRPAGVGYESLPANGRTVIRHNVFHKSGNSSGGGDARPNLLVGAYPLSGDGADDDYLISHNFFFQNPTGFEALFQGEGNLILFGNLLFNSLGPGIFIQPQNGEVRRVRVYQNTLLSADSGIFVSGNVNGAFQQLVRGNAVFSGGTPISGGDQADNVSDSFVNAGLYLANPSAIVSGTNDRMDLFPLAGTLNGPLIDRGTIGAYADFDRDFNDTLRGGDFRGAYAGEGANPGWQLALGIKPQTDDELIFGNGFE